MQHDALDPFLAGLAVLSLVGEAARDRSVLIVVVNAQWLDDESATALSFVGRRLRAERVAMLIAVREMPEAAARFEGLRRLDLAGLPVPQAVDLLCSAAAVPVDAVLATVGATIALTGPGSVSVGHALGLDWTTAWGVGGVALGVAAANATLLRRPPATPASEAGGPRAPVEEVA